jgi:hypothetical protein
MNVCIRCINSTIVLHPSNRVQTHLLSYTDNTSYIYMHIYIKYITCMLIHAENGLKTRSRLAWTEKETRLRRRRRATIQDLYTFIPYIPGYLGRSHHGPRQRTPEPCLRYQELPWSGPIWAKAMHADLVSWGCPPIPFCLSSTCLGVFFSNLDCKAKHEAFSFCIY